MLLVGSKKALLNRPTHSSAAPFNPLTGDPNLGAFFLSDVQVFADSPGVTPATDGSGIRTWNDGSGLGNNTTIAASAGTFKTNQLGTFPALRMNTTAGLAFSGAGLDLTKGKAGLTIHIVTRANSDTAEQRIMGWDTNVASTVRLAICKNIGGTNSGKIGVHLRRLDGDSRTDVNGAAASFVVGTFQLEQYVFDYANNAVGLFVQGASVGTGTTGGAGSTSNTSSATGQLGTQDGVANDSDTVAIAISLSANNAGMLANYYGYFKAKYPTLGL